MDPFAEMDRMAKMPTFERRMSKAEERAVEDNMNNTQEAWRLLYIIEAEFRTDPMSTQCFDARIVERVKIAVAKRQAYCRTLPTGEMS